MPGRHITLFAIGTHGDVRPKLALGRALQAKGWHVCICAYEDFATTVTQAGLEFFPMPCNIQADLSTPEGAAFQNAGKNPVRGLLTMLRLTRRDIPKTLKRLEEAMARTDAVVFNFIAWPAWYLARKRGIPAVMVFFQPLMNCAEYTAPGAPMLKLPGFLQPLYNRLSYHLVHKAMYLPFKQQLKVFYRRNRLLGHAFGGPFAHMSKARVPMLFGFSPSLVARPKAWGPHMHLTGAWFDDADTTAHLVPELAAFLQKHNDLANKPVVIGFGSIICPEPEAMQALLAEALRRLGRPAIVLRGWSGLPLEGWPENVLAVPYAPHHLLYPHVAAVVHHGGAGHTHAAARAGAVQVVVPHNVDQFFWARRVAEAHAGVDLPRVKLTAETLHEALAEATTSPALQAGAAALARHLAAEDGLARAVDVLSHVLGDGQPLPEADAARKVSG